ncbi:MAG: class I SAM-dependent methyltransferase [Flavobacteriales bacterium]|nr:class I SAM-dependent methyltransferase [Flavobacteriales bacterium]
MPEFLSGQTSLNSIELNLLGDIKGKSILHLQCHFGQDTLSLARMGAICTGIDFSEDAISKAKEINHKLRLNATFICSDVYATRDVLNEQFDVVFTSYGTIGWLPDCNLWAKVISESLKPGGRFIMADFHPLVWMMDEDFKFFKYGYFNRGAIETEYSGTYANQDSERIFKETSWNHSLSDLTMSLIRHGLKLNQFQEFDYSPYPCFKHLLEVEPGKFQIKGLEQKIPMVYAFELIKE